MNHFLFILFGLIAGPEELSTKSPEIARNGTKNNFSVRFVFFRGSFFLAMRAFDTQ
jgi:hypothetical protein